MQLEFGVGVALLTARRSRRAMPRVFLVAAIKDLMSGFMARAFADSTYPTWLDVRAATKLGGLRGRPPSNLPVNFPELFAGKILIGRMGYKLLI
jgi:hypothetical protein